MSFETVNLEDLLQLSPNPNFGAWAMQSTQNNSKDIDLLVGCLMQAGVATDKTEALRYLDNLTLNYKESMLVGADFDSITYSQKMKRLHEVYEQSESKDLLLYRMLGVLTHKFAWMLSSGRLPYQTTEEYKNEQQSWMYPSLFSEPSDRLFPEPAPFGNYLSDLKDSRFLMDMSQVVKDVQPILHNSSDWKKRTRNMRNHVHELEKMLRPVLGSYMNELVRYRSLEVGQSEYLTGLTLVIWASIVIQSSRSDDLLILPELPVMHRYNRIGFRRIDGLVIDKIGGRKPNKQQAASIRKCIDAVADGQFKPESVSDLLIMLSKVFSKEVTAHILDYKSAVGDFTNQTDYLIRPKDCPLPGHESQISMYLLLSALDRHLLTGGDETGNPWSTEQGMTKGELLYLLPTSRPRTTKVSRTPNEQHVDFIRNVVMRIPHAREKGDIRRISNLLANHTLHLLDGNTKQAHSSISKHLHTTQLQLFSESVTARGVDKIIEMHRQFADEHRIVEIIHYRNKPGYRLHLDRLFEKITAGVLLTRDFREDKGGFVLCLNPEHKDTSPSMHINLRKGFFKCYSCAGFSGGFDRGSVQRVSNLMVNYQTFAAISRLNQQTMKVVVPERLHLLFKKTQEVLQDCFPASRGAEYMRDVRAIDPFLAHEYGAGFGSDYVVEALIDAGFGYEDMRKAGLIKHRVHLPPHWDLRPLLKGFGYSFEEVESKISDKRYPKPRLGLPYFTLKNRVTFPLMLEGFITNFYGRATWDTQFKHCKLSVTDGAYCHGGFNMQVIDEDHEELILVESIMDALSLLSMGHKSVFAFIGITNYAIIESALRSEKPLALALNNDKGGWGATIKLLEWMRVERQYIHPIRDFTQEFFAANVVQMENPPTDYNEWWKFQSTVKTT
jgi:Toprim-like